MAPILGSGSHTMSDKAACCTTSKCDMTKMSGMTKKECAAMCDEKGCSAEEKAMCLSHYDANGKYMNSVKTSCFDTSKISGSTVKVEITNTNGKSVGTVTRTSNGKVDTKVFEGTQAEVKAQIEALK